MIERDYIMRMVSILTAALARILRLKHAREFPQALAEVDTTGRTLLGLDTGLMHLLSDDQLLELIGKDETLEIPKCYVLGVLLREEGEIIHLQGSPDESTPLYAKALGLLTETYIRHGGPVEADHGRQISFLVGRLKDTELPLNTMVRLFRYYALSGDFAGAEDLLFRIIEGQRTFLNEGILFYERLLATSDDELSRGHLPRDEVEEGLAELRRKAAE